VGDPAYRAPVQRSNIQRNGEGLSVDAQLGLQGSVHKALIFPRVDEYPREISTGSPTAKLHEKGCE
jgi:hypothetical protein